MKANVPRKRIATAFDHARSAIAGGREFYICHVLERYKFNDLDAAKAAIRIIHTRMGRPPSGSGVARDNFALEDWLRRRGHAVPWSGSPEMREYRLRWLDALIKEFSA